MAVLGAMFVITGAGVAAGIIPMLSMKNGLRRGTGNVEETSSAAGASAWFSLQKKENVFRQKALDKIFSAYRDKTEGQYRSGQMLGDIEEYINEDSLSVLSWNNVIQQIPGTLTGLGILGTFIGLITGISDLGFSSVESAISSVQLLLAGIRTAFYTSIAGVILSISFNALHKVTWNVLTRELNIFIDGFHKSIIPPTEEQHYFREQKNMQKIIERLERLPKSPEFSLSASSTWGSGNPLMKNEKILMPQIVDGMANNEFTFVLHGFYDIGTRALVGATALMRWQHPKLGLILPSVFLPVAEGNGYILKLDHYLWENVCMKLRDWLDAGLHPVPVEIHVSKTDILAGDLGTVIPGLAEKYQLPPRYVQVGISSQAFADIGDTTREVVAVLRQRGFPVIMNGFDGDFIAAGGITGDEVDGVELDIRNMPDSFAIQSAFSSGKDMHHTLSAVGIETMEQAALLKKCGCARGQGYFFSKPVPIEEFEEEIR